MRLNKPELRDRLESSLLMTLDDHQEIIASEDIDALTIKQMWKIIRWCAVMMFEASDNPCRARYAPRALRLMLPAGHYLHTWRKPKRVAKS